MHRTRVLGLTVIACLSWTSTEFAQKGGKPKPTDRSATASFRCNGPTAGPLSTWCGALGAALSDSITGDGSSYVGVGDTTSGSGAFLRADGEFALDLRGGPRTIYLNFEHQKSAPSGTFFRKTFTSVALQQFHFNTHALGPNGEEFSGGLTDIPTGESRPARIKSYWRDPYCDCDYTIRFNPTDYPGSTTVTVTRNSDTSWTIEALQSDVAQLVSPAQSARGKPGLTDEGFYYLPFKVTFTVP
jgi:hypothetical protein